MKLNQTGTLELSESWTYIPGLQDSKVDKRSIRRMKNFFKKYLVLFLAVWDELLQDGSVTYYLEGRISLHQLIQNFDFYEDHKEDLDMITTIKGLEGYCRDYNLVNFYGN